ncbi:glycosyltransferase family 2 protein [Actinotalea sp. BY-33]|uniref:4,4'-diaponeurosporenoate glycosyltransferase n=1 Tax=Actinotalea soli TaxID=2819234 RepID=A0A939LPY3_9CELL|nr:glycosyltransferase family 2 protein [Actinotalea soli]MBO1750800.1 glycosyltransferase family 2 protein [Actinotalea soli]
MSGVDQTGGSQAVRLAVVVPARDEAHGIGATLAALRDQEDPDFDLVVVDNGSRDGTGEVVLQAARDWDRPRWRLVHEEQKGTGAAADTGMRAAIAAGATHLARTDADCLPTPDWTARVRAAFATGDELVAGRLVPRTDDRPVSRVQQAVLGSAVVVASTFGRYRPGNRDASYLGPYVMAPGCNMAITSDLYLRAGGFPRTAIEDLHEDRALVNAVRRLTTAYGAHREVVVRASTRRAHAWGLVRTLGWYADHRYRPEVVDIR